MKKMELVKPEQLKEILDNGYTIINGMRITKEHLFIAKDDVEKIIEQAKAAGMTPKEYLDLKRSI